MSAPAEAIERRPSFDDRWPLAEEYPCCTPQCVTWREADGTPAWEHDHNDRCPTRTSQP